MVNTGQNLYRNAKKYIPGGTQLLSKRPEMFLPEHWPAYYKSVQGVTVTDLDGNTYVDMSHNGIGTCILGAADPDVDTAVKAAIDAGTMSTLNCPEEVELAELLIDLHPWAQMVRYARCGGEAMAVAVRIARAKSKRDRIAFCGYHGWHDWYLSANVASDAALDGHLLSGLDPAGVPRSLKDTTIPFRYNRIEELEEIVKNYGEEIGCIVVESIRDKEPANNFLQQIRSIADSIGAILIFDEVSAGFRLACGGAHMVYGVEPDIAVFAKAMSNGYPMAAILGKENVMRAAQNTFISSTYWTERIGPVAAIATIQKHRKFQVHNHLIAMGTLIQKEWAAVAAATGLSLQIGGIPPLSHFAFECEEPQIAKTYFTQEMLKRGYLASTQFYATFAHTKEHVAAYIAEAYEVFADIAAGQKNGSLKERLDGPEAHSGFQRLT
jgi:glutamate-1-semialdehyde 2,1-aminomutase